MIAPPDLSLRLRGLIREVPDFPQPGIRFKDITPLLLDPGLMRAVAEGLAAPYRHVGITRVLGIESRGFLWGPMIAQVLGCGFVIVRKAGKLPPETTGVHYDLEYGSAALEIHRSALSTDDRVLIHDDLLATGGTAAAAARLVQTLGATVSGFGFVIDLAFLPGRRTLEALAPVHALVAYDA